MRSVRFAQRREPHGIDVAVTCDCGATGLADDKTGMTSFNHPVHLDRVGSSLTLRCACGLRHHLNVQAGLHFHVTTLPRGAQ